MYRIDRLKQIWRDGIDGCQRYASANSGTNIQRNNFEIEFLLVGWLAIFISKQFFNAVHRLFFCNKNICSKMVNLFELKNSFVFR